MRFRNVNRYNYKDVQNMIEYDVNLLIKAISYTHTHTVFLNKKLNWTQQLFLRYPPASAGHEVYTSLCWPRTKKN